MGYTTILGYNELGSWNCGEILHKKYKINFAGASQQATELGVGTRAEHSSFLRKASDTRPFASSKSTDMRPATAAAAGDPSAITGGWAGHTLWSGNGRDWGKLFATC